MKIYSSKKSSIISAIAAIVIIAGVLTGCQKEDSVVIDNMEYINIPEIETDPLWFMDEVLNKKHMTAFHRFNSKVDLVNGFLKVKINKGKDINISEKLFEKFNNGVIQTNHDVKDGKYTLAKEDGNIVIVGGVNRNISRLKSGSFTYNGYTYTWMVSDYCTFFGQPQDCWGNKIVSYTHLNANSGIALQNGAGNNSAITTTQSGAWEALSDYLYN